MIFDLNEEKLLVCVGAILVLLIAALVSCHWQSLQNVFSTLVGGVVSITGIYCGGNIAHNWLNNKKPDDDHPESDNK